MIPAEIDDRLVTAAVEFIAKTKVPKDDVIDFMRDITFILVDYFMNNMDPDYKPKSNAEIILEILRES